MKKDYTHLGVVLDRSGSMDSIRKSTIDGFNEFVNGQKEAEGTATLSLLQFDDQFETVYSFVDINRVKPLDEATFVPRGMTALYDAIGKTINSLGEELHKMRESSKPEKVVIVILTDGGENSSTEFKASKLKELITHQTDNYNWQFMFIGANQDAILTASQFGIDSSRAINYSASAVGTDAIFKGLNSKMASYRSGAGLESLNFTKEDRDEQEEAGVSK